MLVDNHYTILWQEGDARDGVVGVRLNPDCAIYAGHFPEMAVSPGVCNMQMVLECASLLSGRDLHFLSVQQCRMTQLIKPDDRILEVRVSLEGDKLQGSITAESASFLTIKAEVG